MSKEKTGVKDTSYEVNEKCSVDSWDDPKINVVSNIPRSRKRKFLVLADLTATPEKQDFTVKEEIREIFIFLGFLIITTVIVLGMSNPLSYYFVDCINSLIMKTTIKGNASSYYIDLTDEANAFPGINLETARTQHQLWTFLVYGIPYLLHSEEDDEINDNDNNNFKNDLLNTSIEFHGERHVIFDNSIILGCPRLRQVRVTNRSCSIPHDDLRLWYRYCYGYFSADSEEKADIPAKGFIDKTTLAWEYRLQPEKYAIWGDIAVYGSGGYFIDLCGTASEVREMLAELQDRNWLTPATRAVFLEFTLYKPGINLFMVARLIAEMHPIGGLQTFGKFYTYKFLRYVSKQDFAILAFELAFIISIGFLTLIVCIKFKRSRYLAFLDYWIILDIIILILSYACIALNLYRVIVIEPRVIQLMHKSDTFVNFDYASTVQFYFDILCAVLLFILWMKLLKFLAITELIHSINLTIARSLPGTLALLLIIFIVTLGFSHVGFILFGSQVQRFSNLWYAFMTIIVPFVGSYEFGDTLRFNQILAPVYFLLFVLVYMFLFAHVFLIIISDINRIVTYEVVPAIDQSVFTYFAKVFNRMKESITLKKKDEEQVKRLTIDDLRNSLERANFQGQEIDVFFSSLNLKCKGPLQSDEVDRVITELHRKDLKFYGNHLLFEEANDIYECLHR